MTAMKKTSVRLDDEVADWLNGLPGSTTNDKLRGLMEGAPSPGPQAPANALVELLDLTRTIAAQMPSEGSQIPDAETIHDIVEDALTRKIEERKAQRGPSFDPASVPGVQRGSFPRRESGAERAAREASERQARAAALDSVQDDSIDRSDEYVST